MLRLIQVDQPPTEKPSNNNKTKFLTLLIIGITLLITGIYLATYTTTTIGTQNYNIYGANISLPRAEQTQPYQTVGIILLISGLCLTIIAAFQTMTRQQ